MLLKLSCGQVKIGCHNYQIFPVGLTATTKEKQVVDTQKNMMKESKYITTKSHQITKEDKKIKRKKKPYSQKTINKMQW